MNPKQLRGFLEVIPTNQNAGRRPEVLGEGSLAAQSGVFHGL
jgi:hypothetical protein